MSSFNIINREGSLPDFSLEYVGGTASDTVQQAAYVDLWRGVFGLVGLHDPAAGGRHAGPEAAGTFNNWFGVH